MKIEDWNWSEETPHRRRLRRLKIGYYGNAMAGWRSLRQVRVSGRRVQFSFGDTCSRGVQRVTCV